MEKNWIDFCKITIRVPRVLQKKAMLVSETDVELLSRGTESSDAVKTSLSIIESQSLGNPHQWCGSPLRDLGSQTSVWKAYGLGQYQS